MSVTNDQSPNRKTDLDLLFWTIAAAIAGAIVFVVYNYIYVARHSLFIRSPLLSERLGLEARKGT